MPGKTPHITIGQVIAGESPAVFAHTNGDEVVLDFVLPRGPIGLSGPAGRDGKHGDHEIVQTMTYGNSPQYNNMMLGCYCICDGVITLPEMTEEECGKWIHFKTFDRLAISGLVEQSVMIEKGSAKFVVIPYGGSFRFTKF